MSTKSKQQPDILDKVKEVLKESIKRIRQSPNPFIIYRGYEHKI